MAQQQMFGSSFDTDILKQAIRAEEERGLLEQAKLSSEQMQNLIQLRSGAGIARGAGNIVESLFGVQAQDPRMRQMQEAQSAYQEALGIAGSADSPDFFVALSNSAARRNLPQLAQQAAVQASTLRSEMAQEFGRRAAGMASLAAASREPAPKALIQVDLGNRIQFRDPVTNQVIEEVKKELTPEQQRKATEGTAEEKPGFIGKTGAYRNQFGEVIPGSEMQKQRTGFQAAEDLLNNINKITSTDIRKAEAKIDYTQGEARKAVAGTFFKGVLDAQTKIAASQLLQQIESLPPGSASDADMRAAARAFPGYSDATALLNWVNRTKATLEQSLTRQSEQYGFSRRVRATSPLEFGARTGAGTVSKKPAGVSDAEWNAMTPEEKALWK